MAQPSFTATVIPDMHQDAPPTGEHAVLVCLVAVPVIWTVLVVTILGNCAAVIATATTLAVLAGGSADCARIVWLRRRYNR